MNRLHSCFFLGFCVHKIQTSVRSIAVPTFETADEIFLQSLLADPFAKFHNESPL